MGINQWLEMESPEQSAYGSAGARLLQGYAEQRPDAVLWTAEQGWR
ncbi:hypothetical protein [Mycobacterium sp. 94-17]|nr:hypothetical protein [Mycobacterium sp. 94-17]MEB4210958.1 hypothetical protein [Mycobacterium sp. 94-17]